jgi:FtsP/CotA-like multicopper oxidase with cupredoxin domain
MTFELSLTWFYSSELDVEWDHPTVKYIFDNDIKDLPAPGNGTLGENVINLGEANKFHFFAIQNTGGLPHPIHLHGHDFYILGQFTSQFTESMIPSLNFLTPMRRDVAMLPNSGSLIIAFESNNPGAWLMHCHVSSIFLLISWKFY